MLMMQKMHALQVSGGAAGFTVNAVEFDGTNDSLSRSSLTGQANSATGILSCWLRLDVNTTEYFLTNGNNRLLVSRTSNQFNFAMESGTGSSFSFRSSSYSASSTWLHVLSAWDTNFSAGNKIRHLYINDVSDSVLISDASGAFTVRNEDAGNWQIGEAAGTRYNGGMAEFWYTHGQFLDFSVQANRRKFISSTGKPVDLGATGSLPTGTAPLIYLNNSAASFGTNKGTGGDFTITGTLDAASTRPSD